LSPQTWCNSGPRAPTHGPNTPSWPADLRRTRHRGYWIPQKSNSDAEAEPSRRPAPESIPVRAWPWTSSSVAIPRGRVNGRIRSISLPFEVWSTHAGTGTEVGHRSPAPSPGRPSESRSSPSSWCNGASPSRRIDQLAMRSVGLTSYWSRVASMSGIVSGPEIASAVLPLAACHDPMPTQRRARAGGTHAPLWYHPPVKQMNNQRIRVRRTECRSRGR
jgi:hypothetical protein